MIVGVTGKSGSGKSTISKLISKFGNCFNYIEVDEIGHRVLDDPKVRNDIKEKFGIDVSSTSRKALGDLVFSNRHNMKELSDLTYHHMEKLIEEEIQKYPNCVIDWILLPHTKFFEMCDLKILVKSKKSKRETLVMERDGISKEYFEKREGSSIEYDDKKFDYIIYNNYKEMTDEKVHVH